jgi:hypothetical protein
MFWFFGKKKIKDEQRKTEKLENNTVKTNVLTNLYFDTDSEYKKNEAIRKINDKFGTGGKGGFI